MNSIKVLTEAGYNKGFGHFQRMLSIQERAEKESIPFEMIVDGDESARKNLERSFVTFKDWQCEETPLAGIVEKNDTVVVDSYHISLNKLEEIADSCRYMIVIDDNIRLDYHDMNVLNPNYYGEFLDYPEDKGNKYYLGKDYTLIKEAFRTPENRIVRREVKDVLITMGGTDAKGETVKCIRSVKAIDPEVRLHVVVTSAYKDIVIIKNELGADDILYSDLSPEDMSKRMVEADFAISSAGGTSNELIRMQCPAVLNVVAPNQINNTRIMSEQGCFILLSDDDRKAIVKMFSVENRKTTINNMKRFSTQKNGALFIVEKTNRG